MKAKLAESGGKAQQLVTQGGVTLNGEKVTDWKHPISLGKFALTVGRRTKVELEVVA